MGDSKFSLIEVWAVHPLNKDVPWREGWQANLCCSCEWRDTSEEIVVRCCAVKRGMDKHNFEPESDIASLWRMSVNKSHRGQGIATKLMETCEEYAKTQLKCKQMGVWKLNPMAVNFYMNKMGYSKENYMYISDNWVAKLFIPPVSSVLVWEKVISLLEAVIDDKRAIIQRVMHSNDLRTKLMHVSNNS